MRPLLWLLLLLAPAAFATPDARLVVWRLQGGRVEADDGAPREPLPVGSLQKPFVAQAWALAHQGAALPRVRCERGSGCWRASGHGACDLVRALTLSCNTYFLRLARDTPPEDLTRTLRAEGFVVPAPPSPEAAIGLPDGAAPIAIAPDALLRAYSRLATTPWPAGEPVRRLVLQGLREAARIGTAGGIAQRGYWAKTGTVAALDATPLRTSGWALALDDSGFGLLALLPHGTGREAAAALGATLRHLRTSQPPTGAQPTSPQPLTHVRVRLLDLLAPRHGTATNAGTVPLPALSYGPCDDGATTPGWLGPGGTLALVPGLRVAEGLWELRAPEFGFVRRVQGALAVARAPRGGLRLTADVALDEYVNGVVAAEAPHASAALREELAAAVLRFLALGPRHAPGADVCDGTHCAVFAGRGPRLAWLSPRRAQAAAGGSPPARFDDAAWARVQAQASQAGPRRFTGHCGGAPLSERYVWGAGDERVRPCPRHAAGPAAAWRRHWSGAALRAAFGAAPRDVRVDDADGVWRLVVDGSEGTRRLRFDDAHRRLAAVLGWDALPSPAARVRAAPGGFTAQGAGRGHRVGLCLDQAAPPRGAFH